MMSSPTTNSTAERPEFAVVLGLLPPYTMDDVKRAYLAKVKGAHPDRGGDRADFDRIQHAFEQASEYLSFRSDRREWIAARMDEYVAAESLANRLRQLGAVVETTMHDWVKRSFGDFATLTASIIGVRLENSERAAELVDAMVVEQRVLAGLKRLELPGCAVTDGIAMQLRVFTSLTHLDLSRTQISQKALVLVDRLRRLETFNIDGTSIGWWGRRKIRQALARRNVKRLASVLHPENLR
jgi:hypothetical protein